MLGAYDASLWKCIFTSFIKSGSMRHGTNNQNQNNNNRRPRGRTHQHGNKRPQHNNGGNRTQNFDSNGPQGRIRGTAKQIHEKYTQLAKDAISAGDRVLVESLFQFADHYGRIAALSAPKPRPEVEENTSESTAVASEVTETTESAAKSVEVVEVVVAAPEPVAKVAETVEPEPEEKPRRRAPRATTPRAPRAPRAARQRIEENTPKLGGGTTAVPDFLARPVEVETSVTEETVEKAVVEEKPKRARRTTTRKTPAVPRTRRKKADDDAPKTDDDKEAINV